MEQQPKARRKRRRYTRPRLEIVEIKLDEVLAMGCKTSEGGGFPACSGDVGCGAPGSS
jgi:hypothetical protein